MAGINGLLDIGRSALTAYQRALAVTGHNISNLNTPGYTRQQAVLAPGYPIGEVPGQVGSGVQVSEIRRSVDGFLEAQVTQSHQEFGHLDVLKRSLAGIEGLFGDANDQGIGAALNEFFSAAQDVATNPTDQTARTVLLSKAQTLVGQFNVAATRLNDQRRLLDLDVGHTIVEVNQLAAQIADLNGRIAAAEVGGEQNANDLRDERGRLINELAQRINVSTLEDETGQVSLFVGRGQPLVMGRTAHTLAGTPNAGNTGYLDVQFDGDGPPVTINNVVTGGRLKGLLDVRDTTIPTLLASLDTLASSLVTGVNQVHAAGFGLDGSTGLSFFNPAGLTAATIGVALTDGNRIAASGSAGGVPGSNTNALALAALRTGGQGGLGGATFADYYRSTVAGVGTAARAADQDLKAQQFSQAQLDAYRSSVSGVSLDEELVTMLQSQRAFEAASRIIVMTDQLLQTIVSMKQ